MEVGHAEFFILESYTNHIRQGHDIGSRQGNRKMGQKGPVPLRRRFHQGTKGRPFLISLVVLLDSVPGTLFLKTPDSSRYLAIPVELVEVVPGTEG